MPSKAFTITGRGEVVTLGPATVDLGTAAIRQETGGGRIVSIDPVSRLVILRGSIAGGAGFRLAEEAPFGGLLRAGGTGPDVRIEGRVERVRGKYLPFTLLRLRYAGSPAARGTPLFDASGQVAAVAHEAESGSVGYAVPVEVVRRVLDGSVSGGRVDRAWLGLTLNPANRAVRVTGVVANSPAARAGIRKGDLLEQVDERRVADYGDAVNAFFLLRPGTAAPVKVRRGVQETVLNVVPARSGK